LLPSTSSEQNITSSLPITNSEQDKIEYLKNMDISIEFQNTELVTNTEPSEPKKDNSYYSEELLSSTSSEQNITSLLPTTNSEQDKIEHLKNMDISIEFQNTELPSTSSEQNITFLLPTTTSEPSITSDPAT